MDTVDRYELLLAKKEGRIKNGFKKTVDSQLFLARLIEEIKSVQQRFPLGEMDISRLDKKMKIFIERTFPNESKRRLKEYEYSVNSKIKKLSSIYGPGIEKERLKENINRLNEMMSFALAWEDELQFLIKDKDIVKPEDMKNETRKEIEITSPTWIAAILGKIKIGYKKLIRR